MSEGWLKKSSAAGYDASLVAIRLEEVWFGHLDDNIWSVRENAAVALGKPILAHGI